MKAAKLYRQLANKLFWYLLTFLSLMAYIVEIRPFFYLTAGNYFVGLIDGMLATILALIAIFYSKSRNCK